MTSSPLMRADKLTVFHSRRYQVIGCLPLGHSISPSACISAGQAVQRLLHQSEFAGPSLKRPRKRECLLSSFIKEPSVRGRIDKDAKSRIRFGGEPMPAKTRTQKAKSGVDRIGVSGADSTSSRYGDKATRREMP
jgi:hypothetical protein